MPLPHDFLYGKRLDFPDFIGRPQKIICLYFIPRSGSNFLADLMRQTGRIGFPLEYFSPNNLNVLSVRMPMLSIDHLDPLFTKRTSQNGVFCFKWNSNFENLEYGEKLRNALAPDYNIFIDRQDRVAQARSYFIALNTGTWVRRKGDTKMGPYVEPSKNQINQTINEIENMRKATLQLVENTSAPYLKLNAEDLFSDPARSMLSVFQHCEIDCQNLTIPTQSIWTAPSKSSKLS